MKKILVTPFLVLLFVSVCSGFDNNRKGFVLGVGAGLAPLSQFSNKAIKENEPALGFNFIIGHGLDNRNIVAFESNFTYRDSDYYSEIGRRTRKTFVPFDTLSPFHGSQTITQGIQGVSWYHYFSPLPKASFTIVGVGFYTLSPKSISGTDPGLGFLLGGGHGLSRHIQIAGYYSHGQSNGGNSKHDQVSVLISYIAY